MTYCALAAHSIERQCQHERRLIPGGVDSGRPARVIGLISAPYMQGAGVQLEVRLEFVGEHFKAAVP